MATRRVEMRFQDGHSDKVYNLEFQDHGALFSVYFEYGRRGSTMNTGFKTANVSHTAAQKAFDKILHEKTGKGYQVTSDTEGAPLTQSVKKEAAKIKSKYEVQLLNAVNRDDIDKYIKDPSWGMQEKIDGERRPISISASRDGIKVLGFNRKNEEVDLHASIRESLFDLPLDNSLALDAEVTGDHLYVFDAMEVAGNDMTNIDFLSRYKAIDDIFNDEFFPGREINNIHLVQLAVTEDEKRNLFNRIEKSGGEGVVIKKLFAPYTSGRPNSGGNALKCKFIETASFVVTKINDKRSISLAVVDEHDAFVEVGNVAIPVSHEIPIIGNIVEVAYLYAFMNGSIFQPVYKGKRNDLTRHDCRMSKLKYKQLASSIVPLIGCGKSEAINTIKSYAW